MDTERHFQYFRMSAGAFDDLLRRVAPHIQHKPSHSAPVSVAERLAVTLRYLATGMSQQATSWGEQWEGIRREFWEMWNYPNCIGAIDGKHVRAPYRVVTATAPPRLPVVLLRLVRIHENTDMFLDTQRTQLFPGLRKNTKDFNLKQN
ncbi:hypothetical protein N1851_021443 [Merluccius polli]|uniref:Uncharacterized protein n=1 Tax=Merluccius polli TaxID=89951 RepID=A0AA47MJG2_MERPO|nr:hypothetical protein N1851_021443 [Merluccius polli]